ncbi:hypothetical protein BH10PSE17_BH10PSE17_14450 [soil metagenome]
MTLPDVSLDPFVQAVLVELAEAPDQTMSLPRLCKRIGVNASVMLRQLTLLSDAKLGGSAGPGWVRVERIEDRWLVRLTPLGRDAISPA